MGIQLINKIKIETLGIIIFCLKKIGSEHNNAKNDRYSDIKLVQGG
ncbi:hypothetical protein [Acinetobacter sp. 10FS3-1]|nr:hypothetical protein [Acinetobacter sp. 10FS3-1]